MRIKDKKKFRRSMAVLTLSGVLLTGVALYHGSQTQTSKYQSSGVAVREYNKRDVANELQVKGYTATPEEVDYLLTTIHYINGVTGSKHSKVEEIKLLLNNSCRYKSIHQALENMPELFQIRENVKSNIGNYVKKDIEDCLRILNERG